MASKPEYDQGQSRDDRRRAAVEGLVRDCKETAERMGNVHVTERQIREHVARTATEMDRMTDSKPR